MSRKEKKKNKKGETDLKESLMDDLNKQTASVMMGGLCTESQCSSLARKFFDIYNVNSDDKMDLDDCKKMINDCYKQMGYRHECEDEDGNILISMLDKSKKGYINQADMEENMKKHLV